MGDKEKETRRGKRGDLPLNQRRIQEKDQISSEVILAPSAAFVGLIVKKEKEKMEGIVIMVMF